MFARFRAICGVKPRFLHFGKCIVALMLLGALGVETSFLRKMRSGPVRFRDANIMKARSERDSRRFQRVLVRLKWRRRVSLEKCVVVAMILRALSDGNGFSQGMHGCS